MKKPAKKGRKIKGKVSRKPVLGVSLRSKASRKPGVAHYPREHEVWLGGSAVGSSVDDDGYID